MSHNIMAALRGNQNAKGNKGNSTNDREQISRIKYLLGLEIERVLKEDDKNNSFRQQLILKLAGSYLPRPVEVGNLGNEPLEIIIKRM